MKPTPMILGAMALAIGAGTAVGMSTPTDPLSRYGDTFDNIPRHATQFASVDEQRRMIAPRDQYPLVTPEGTIEVAELVFHGRLRDRVRRVQSLEQSLGLAASEEGYYSARNVSFEQAQALDAQQPIPQPSDDRLETARLQQASYVPLEQGIFEQRVAVREIPARNMSANRLAQREAANDSRARTIDVEAELAARN